MGYYKIEMQPITSIVGKITSITLFGALCYAIKDLYGEDTLRQDILVNNDGSNLAVSNLFPHNTLPNQDIDSLYTDIYTGKSIMNKETIQTVNHCLLDRDGKETTLWTNKETWLESTYDFYIYSKLFDIDDIKQIITLVLKNGLGAKRSVGKGQFKLKGIEEIEYIGGQVEKANGYMVISDYIPKPEESTLGIYTARIYQGAIGGVKKAPIYLINAGSKFIGKVESGIVGRLQYDEITNTYTSGIALTIPIMV